MAGARTAHRTLLERIRAGDSYGLLLILLIVDYLGVLLLDEGPVEHAITTATLVVTLVLALRISKVSHRTQVAARILSVAVLVAVPVLNAVDVDALRGSGYVITAALVAMAPVAVLRRILTHRVVSTETILGAICVYLLIGMLAATMLQGIVIIDPGSVSQSAGGPVLPTDTLYLSFVTLTTVGFGDIVAVSNVGRAVVTLEAVIGQIFLVVVVARLVALYRGPRSRREDPEEGDGS
jgi:hypothetical protein